MRRDLVQRLAKLAEFHGRTPSSSEVTAAFGARWQRLSMYFIGRPAERGQRPSIGYVRWMRLAGLKRRRRGDHLPWSPRVEPSVYEQERRLQIIADAERLQTLSGHQWRCACSRLNDPAHATAQGRRVDICAGCGAAWRGAA
jgi:hypothetical protein